MLPTFGQRLLFIYFHVPAAFLKSHLSCLVGGRLVYLLAQLMSRKPGGGQGRGWQSWRTSSSLNNKQQESLWQKSQSS